MREIETLWEEVREVSLGTQNQIERLGSPPSPLRFLRDFVSLNKPCLISNAISHWPALSLWPTPSYLSSSLSHSPVSLHLTPTGRADSPAPSSPSPCFASAHVDRVPFPRALHLVAAGGPPGAVAYLQQQNDCFREEYAELAPDCDPHVPWASEAFGCLPDAVNLWIGNGLSTTSFHKDHYENIYAVVSGEKHFLLLPPTDVHRLYLRDYPAARWRYSQESGEFSLEMEEPVRYVPWSSVDPYPPLENKESEMAKYPLYFNGPEPFMCTVKAGEMLYLQCVVRETKSRNLSQKNDYGNLERVNISGPSMWFHHVRQSPDEHGRTIAINYWYDMQFDIKYAYFNFLQSLNFRPRMAGPE